MKNKATLSLMEQVLMGLVFAIAAAICLKVFAYSDSLSKQGERADEAALLAQNVAEILVNTHGDLAAAEKAGNTGTELETRVEKTETGNSMLGGATIKVSDGSGPVYELYVSWQEG